MNAQSETQPKEQRRPSTDGQCVGEKRGERNGGLEIIRDQKISSGAVFRPRHNFAFFCLVSFRPPLPSAALASMYAY